MAFFRELQRIYAEMARIYTEMARIYTEMARKLGRIGNSETNKQDLLANIPPEIMIEILSRLAIPSVMRCKCVCKSWMNLLESVEFGKSHAFMCEEDLPVAVSLFHGQRSWKSNSILELIDTQSSAHPFHVVLKFNSPFNKDLCIHSSVNGLLLMVNEDMRHLSICNPITREYIKLPPLSSSLPRSYSIPYLENRVFGFGVSKVSGKYKVVRVSDDCNYNKNRLAYPYAMNTSKCEVYTLGTGSWRSVAAGGLHRYKMVGSCVFLNGNLHWLGRGLVEMGNDFSSIISVLDLENEYFSALSSPDCVHYFSNLCTIRGSLCLCGNDAFDVEIWLMNKYGDDKSWRKEFVIANIFPHCELLSLVPQQISKDGDIVFVENFRPQLCCYSRKTRVITPVDLTKLLGNISLETSIIYSPSFLPLQTLTMEDVTTF